MDVLDTVKLVTLCLPPTRGEDALTPRNRGIIHKELDLNQRALSSDQLEGKSQTIHHAHRGWQNDPEI